MTLSVVLSQTLQHLKPLLGGEPGRLIATVLVVAAAFAAHWLNVRYLGRKSERDSRVEPGAEAPLSGRKGQERLRRRFVVTKNVLVLTTVLIVVTIWASKIAGVALSLAAFASAVVLSGKELIMCCTGYALYAMARPYGVGDFIEINGISGRVIDVDLFSTTLAEIATAHQLTGRSVTFPNSLLLSQPVRNQTATGDYVINLLRVAVPYDCDRARCERVAIEAGEEVCRPWLKEADLHLRRIEDEDFIDLPSSEVKVLWESDDTYKHWLVIRFASPIQLRVTAEQDILRRFWAKVSPMPGNIR
ncbi:conserved hypothetical protein [Ricinus communis]|uniref:Mechanosensitive ion channel MscS domain-containing protein n=1 Tax=Ricinus communis TaxID=3988 RepID=B9TES9_RICCO|nr:conserved hypothetical protein [Ricinus communis]